jgi:hypothetical protein
MQTSQHLAAGDAYPGQFAGRTPAVGEHGDRFSDDDVEGIVVERERTDVRRLDHHPFGHPGGADVGFGPSSMSGAMSIAVTCAP